MPTAVLSTTAKAKERARKKEADKKEPAPAAAAAAAPAASTTAAGADGAAKAAEGTGASTCFCFFCIHCFGEGGRLRQGDDANATPAGRRLAGRLDSRMPLATHAVAAQHT